jgi:hypothetical protein
MADVAAPVARRGAAVSEAVYEAILREVPQLRDDKPVLTLLASSVDSNVDTCLQIMQHRIDLAAVRAPAAATEYARRLAQRRTPLTALLRDYRVGHVCFSDWMPKELARPAGNAEMISAATLSMSRVVAGYIDQTSEEMVAAYAQARENWLRNRSATRAVRIRDLLAGGRIDVGAAEVTLGYRLRQYHVGLVCWVGDVASAADEITRLEQAIGHVAGKAPCPGDPVFMPRDGSSAWAWLPLGVQDTFDRRRPGWTRMSVSPSATWRRERRVPPDPPDKNTVQYRIRKAKESLGTRSGQRPDPLRRRACEPVGLVVDVHGDLRQGGRVLPVVVRAEQQLQTVWEQGPDVSLGAAAVTAVPGGKRPGKGPVRRLALLLPVSASGPEFASAQDDHLLWVAGIRVTKVHSGRPQIGKRWHLWCHHRALWRPAVEVRVPGRPGSIYSPNGRRISPGPPAPRQPGRRKAADAELT